MYFYVIWKHLRRHVKHLITRPHFCIVALLAISFQLGREEYNQDRRYGTKEINPFYIFVLFVFGLEVVGTGSSQSPEK